MSIEKEFVPYQPSLELKELGFDEPCIMQWTYAPELIFCTSTWAHPKLKTNKESYSDSGGDCISAPTFSQAFGWFREKYKLYSWITMELGNKSTFCWVLSGEHTSTQYAAYFHTYEEAELACLRKLIEIVKNK
jgi:hypothetical protein